MVEIKNQCPGCKLIHPPMVDCATAQAAAMRTLLMRISEIGRCKACGVTLFWVKHITGAPTPYTVAGLIHFADCPNADRFRKKKVEPAKNEPEPTNALTS